MEREKIHLTSLEKRAKQILDELGVNYIEQYPTRLGFIIDFAIPDKKIAIEVDGKHWHKDKKRDRFRDWMLRRAGWKVIRINEDEIKNLKNIKLII
ncbi:MAG TPA: DUF559 domain-containing protein [candidate division WOR-3 bacterium]|uniref:DUF559 domain-containing protein n=1 Tax=candidate division WOR-3 bacterium TaxID=2052148 RepID=A0A7V5LTR7_UNCW3|nr:DUF559 domain-containing protein [candidate division WOR-3 bacterium]